MEVNLNLPDCQAREKYSTALSIHCFGSGKRYYLQKAYCFCLSTQVHQYLNARKLSLSSKVSINQDVLNCENAMNLVSYDILHNYKCLKQRLEEEGCLGCHRRRKEKLLRGIS